MRFGRRDPDVRGLPFDLVPQPDAKQAIADVIASFLTEMQMEIVRPWMWAAPLSDGPRPTFSIQEYKGGMFQLEYGVCCSWVPHYQGATWRWHRTFKQTRNDLHVSQAGVSFMDVGITYLRGLDAVRLRAEHAIKIVRVRAAEWWAGVTDDAGVLTEALRLRQSMIGWTAEGLVAAFTSARIGDPTAARRYLRGVEPWPDVMRYEAASALLEAAIAAKSQTPLA